MFEDVIYVLDYEKKLHLDEAWKKLNTINGGANIFRLIIEVVIYSAMFLLLKWLLLYIPDLSPWSASPVLFSIGEMPLTAADIVYFILGFAIHIYGTVRYIGINKQNHSVRSNSDTPSRLLTDGYYAKLRHPMYGAFIIMAASVFLSVRSLIGLVIAVLFTLSQYLNAAREEKKSLISLFGEQYKEYTQSVKGMILKKWEASILLGWLLISILGLFI